MNHAMGSGDMPKSNAASVAVRPLSTDSEGIQQSRQREGGLGRISRHIRDWTPAAFLVSYLVFSISLYVLVDSYATKIFWFLYLTIATLLAGTTTLEAYDGLTPLRDARKATRTLERNEWKFKGSEDDLPHVDLVFDNVTPDGSGGGGHPHIDDGIRAGIAYPAHKIRVTVLGKHQGYHVDVEGDDSFRRIWIPEGLAASVARFRTVLELGESSSPPPVTVLLSGSERLHPHALRSAVDRLVQNQKIQVVQGRSVLASPRHGSMISMLASLQHDLTNALIKPGRASTWGVGVATGYGSVWRTASLRDAIETLAASGGATADATDLAYAAYANGAKGLHDLSVITYSPSPRTIRQYFSYQVRDTVRLVNAAASWSKLAFTRAAKDQPQAARSIKARMGLLYALPVQLVAAHTVLQLLSWSLALLFTRTPNTASDLADALYWSSPVSEWFVILGAVCLVSTVGLAYKARSEFVDAWTLPIAITTYPITLAVWAAFAVYGQVEAISR
ncbi:glycosyltransferase family 2 protein [Polychaeton citri CBS 116435]|uniref:Glycosyltransferase family 2 protein n=1 Tax=Polychaeton citri CBS 116435 TaxID=1314669 RepID=A0A9P4ULZ6_9PEZI|nr:glycosyltransferase family 2 protein [Polychaeton citri CBS 116435]